jgi:hypothetical protein
MRKMRRKNPGLQFSQEHVPLMNTEFNMKIADLCTYDRVELSSKAKHGTELCNLVDQIIEYGDNRTRCFDVGRCYRLFRFCKDFFRKRKEEFHLVSSTDFHLEIKIS